MLAKRIALALVVLGLVVEASAHTWTPPDAVWVGFAFVLAGFIALWFSGASK